MGQRSSLAERFWPKVQTSNDAECWAWTGHRDYRGYGRINAGGKHGAALPAHRVSWQLHHGPIPAGMCVCHHCDNPPCVNPEHLFLGTHTDNMQDKVAKGRDGAHTHPEAFLRGEQNPMHIRPEIRPVGERNAHAKLRSEAVLAIRREFAEEHTAISDLAVRYGVGRQMIARIIRRANWRHI